MATSSMSQVVQHLRKAVLQVSYSCSAIVFPPLTPLSFSQSASLSARVRVVSTAPPVQRANCERTNMVLCLSLTAFVLSHSWPVASPTGVAHITDAERGQTGRYEERFFAFISSAFRSATS